MCGIGGILRTDCEKVDDESVMRLMNRMKHRGPDGWGVHSQGRVTLGHRRLSIIDLEGGRQPIVNEDGAISLTFNGEIYNYRELRQELIGYGHSMKTCSDSEVIVHAFEQWGERCVTHLRGMFAFAIWDSREGQLFLARDRMGIKPLCYFQKPGLFAFASEMQALRSLEDFRGTLDPEALDLYLHLQYIPAPFSIYREIRKLPPAHSMTVRSDGRVVGPTRYWDLMFEPETGRSEGEWIERVDAALRESVQAHLVSDVPFGAFLSGGVDSSIVVAHMSRLLDIPVKTFTIGFDEGNYDERRYAATAGATLGTEHYEEVVRPDALGLLPVLAEHYGEPFADSSAVCAYYVSQAARRHVKMVLSGDGGDEIFAGYSYFAKMLKHHPQPRGVVQKGKRLLGNAGRRLGLRAPLPSPRRTWHDRSPYFGEVYRKRLWRSEHQYLIEGTRAWNDAQFEPARRADLLSQCQYVDTHNYLPYDNLAKIDIASMCHGLEVRVPLLDHVFLDTVRRIPPELKIRWSGGGGANNPVAVASSKDVFKKVGERYFPPRFFDRQKMGFSIPIGEWIAGPYGTRAGEILRKAKPELESFFDYHVVEQLFAENAQRGEHGHRLWAMLFLSEWIAQSKTIPA